MTATKTHLPSLTTLPTSRLGELLVDVVVELTERSDHDGAALVAVMGSLGRSMGLLGRSVGLGYARAWTDTDTDADTGPYSDCRLEALSEQSGRPVASESAHPLTMYGLQEDLPGPQWSALFAATWAGYRAWYTSEGLDQRPDLATCRTALEQHMPELVPTWQRLVDLTGGDPLAARMLSLWDAPAYATGCSQLVVDGGQRVLIRNYDYDPTLFEQVVYSTQFGSRRVIGTADCLWGLLDGMNDDGLVVSLTYGGQPGTGPGFAIPLVVRYLLEVCATVEDAREVLQRLPMAAAYNLTISDAIGATATVFVSPNSAPEVFDTPLATNHRGLVPEYPELAKRLNSVERQEALQQLLDTHAGTEHATSAFLQPPLHNTAFSRGFATLYTAVYQPDRGIVDYLWPDASWRREFDSPHDTKDVILREPAAA
jgi:predicted choloylglycine hydrolase